MITIDLKRDLKSFYSPSARGVGVVVVPEFSFIIVDGVIPPGSTPGESNDFHEAIGAIYSAAYTLKFACKKRADNALDYPVMPLEGLWNVPEVTGGSEPDGGMKWRLMILQPDQVTQQDFRDAVDVARGKRENPALDRLRLEKFDEGLSIQMMHIGPYSEETAALERMRVFADENDYVIRAGHHEIYLGDPRRANPARLKTILRQAVTKAG